MKPSGSRPLGQDLAPSGRMWLAGHMYSRDQPHGEKSSVQKLVQTPNAATWLRTRWLAIGGASLDIRGFSKPGAQFKACRVRLAPGTSNCRRAAATTRSANSLAGAGESARSSYGHKLEGVHKNPDFFSDMLSAFERVVEDVFVCCKDNFLKLCGFVRGEGDISV